MLKLPVLLFFIFGTATLSNAQRLVFIFGHGEYAQPTGDLQDAYKNGFGAEAGLGIGIKSTFITGTIGYTSFSPESNIPTGRLNVIPYKLGIRHYVFRKNIFVKADGGLATLKYSKGGSESQFIGDVGVGVKFMGMEVLADYNMLGAGRGSWIGMKAGFVFGI